MTRVNTQSRFIEMFGNPVTNTKKWLTEPLEIVAPESPSENRELGQVWILNLDMVESQSGRVIEKVYDCSDNLNSVSPFDKGNVLFSKLRPYLNKVVIPDGNGYATTELVPLRPNETKMKRTFLAYLLRSDDFVGFADSIATGTKMPRMPMQALRSFECILPPIQLQEEFIGVAEQADKSKFSDFKSRFIEECYSRYPKQKLGGHISVIRGVSYKPSDVRSSVDEGVAIILRSNNIADGEINFDNLVYVVHERVQKEQILKPGDIVMCGSNGSISLVGKAGLLKENIPNTAFGAFCLGIKCKETILPEYLNTYFNTQVYRNEIESMGNGTNIINIRPDNITNLSIPIPPVEKQKAFVEVVNQADKSKYLN